MVEKRHRTYRFGDYLFIPDRQLLLHAGVPVTLGSRAMELLHLLVERSGELIGKDELRQHVWPNTQLHESNLKVTVSALRRALSPGAGERPFIMAVPGRGYRFVAAVEMSDGSPLAADKPGLSEGTPLPAAPAIVGRGQEIGEVEALLSRHGWVTIVGPAGVGKTTIALGGATRLAPRLRDGARFVDLAALTDPQLVSSAIGLAVGIAGEPSDRIAAIAALLADREMLLLLDNCEHLLSAVATIADVLRSAAPGIRILATSREAMRSRSETVYRLEPLACPPAALPLDATDALAYSAVELFVRLAETTQGYALSDTDAPAIAAICRRLEGIALAIELAVARLADADPTTLLALLERSFEPLNQGTPDTIARHQTLLATMDWSYRLLSPEEAGLFRLMSVFTNSFALDDLIGVTAGEHGPPAGIAAATDSLVAKSLLSVAYGHGDRRYRLLETTRCFAARALIDSGEFRQVHHGFARQLLALFQRAEREWEWRTRAEWTAAYGPRANDLRKAIDWAFGAQGNPLLGVELTAAAIPLWDELSSVGESLSRAGRALRAIGTLEAVDTVLTMKLIASHASGLNFSEHLGPEVDAAWEQGHRLAEQLGSVDYQLRSLWGHAVLQSFTGRHGEALSTLDRFLRLAGTENERSAIPDGTRLTLMTRFYMGEVEEAQAGLAALARDHGRAAPSRMARFQIDRFVGIRVALAMAAWVRGDHGEAMALMRAALERAKELDHRMSQSNALAQIGIPLALQIGHIDEAREHAATLARNLSLRETAIWGPVSRFHDAAIAARDGDADAPLAMQGAVEELIANNFLVRVPFYLAMTAEAALDAGRIAQARSNAASAHIRMKAQAEHWCAPEVLRVGALVRWREGEPAEAERGFMEAVEAARRIGAGTFELRAATALAELRIEAGRRIEAALGLAPVFARFDPDVPSADVRRAGEVLDRLKAGDRPPRP